MTGHIDTWVFIAAAPEAGARLTVRIHAGGTRLMQGETFQALLVPWLWRRLEPSSRAGFEAMDRTLNARAEAPAGTSP